MGPGFAPAVRPGMTRLALGLAMKPRPGTTRFAYATNLPWQCLYFLPDPQGQGSLRPTRPQLEGSFGSRSARRCASRAALRRKRRAPDCRAERVLRASPSSFSPVAGSRCCANIGGSSAGSRLLEHHLDAHELARHLLAQMADEVVEELERLRLVLVQRIALGIAAPADDLAQVVEGHEMLAPEMVEALQQDLLLDIGHDLGRVRLDALRVGLVGGLAEALADLLVGDALFLGPFLDRQVEVEAAARRPPSSPPTSHCSG